MSKEAIEHYEAALKEAFPSGATGDVFYHWNEARKALAEQPAQQQVGINGLTEAETNATASVMGLVNKTQQQEPVKDLMYSTVATQERHAAFVDRAVATLEQAKREALADKPAPATELREQEPVSDRENAIIRFALHQFMSNAYSNMNAAAQDKDSRHYTVGAVEKFAKDAKDAEALLSRLQFKAPQPAQRKPWVGLTDEEIEKGRNQTFSINNPYCPCDSKTMQKAVRWAEAKLREKNQ